jgi:hypothetical protein
MKRLLEIFAALLLIIGGGLGSCKLIVGPSEPAGNSLGGAGGTLTISFGEGRSDNNRAITSGADLPGDVLAGMRYDLILTGPNNETIERTVSGGETLSLTVTAGQWRIDSQGYYLDALAGTGSVNVTVLAGENPVRIPMMMSGPCYEVTVDSGIVHGAVQTNFALAFEGTPVTLTVTPDSDSVLKAGTFTYNDGSDHVIAGSVYAFAMPASDVTASAEFIQFVRYARADGTGDGASWANASSDIQKAMDELAAIPASDYAGPRIVKAAAGTYTPYHKPDGSGVSVPAAGDRDSTFILRQGVQVWGGYPASGGDDPSRNIAANKTILNGDNAYHVVLAVGVDRKTVLNGLTITGGNANGGGDITVLGKQVERNNGGGMFNIDSSPALVNVTISGNAAGNNGGGMYNDYSSPALVNVTISGNNAVGNDGGGVNNSNSSPVLVNVLISGNRAFWGGSGMKNADSNPILTNVTISGNSTGSGFYKRGSIYNANSSPRIKNSIIWGNMADSSPGIFNDDPPNSTPVITHSIVQESGGSGSWASATGTDGGDNLDTNPQFVSPVPASSSPTTGGDYRLNGGPAVNAGNNSLYPDTWAKWLSLIGAGEGITAEAEYNMYIAPHLGGDPAGANRKNGTIDMGAYEKE